MSDNGASKQVLKIALAGNPNSGKTTLFNAITGAHHKVGNYPGVTVEKREGVKVRKGRQYHFVDLPGIYSLTAYSIDEVVARDFILDERPDVIVDVLDSTNIERNLYLCLQFQELGIPVIGALNMSDEAEAKGIKIDEKHLSKMLGIPMVKTVGPKGIGIDELLDSIDRIADEGSAEGRSLNYGDDVETRLASIRHLLEADRDFAGKYPSRWFAVKLLEKDSNAYERLAVHPDAGKIIATAKEAVKWIEMHYAKDAEIIITEQRYGYIRGAVRESVQLVKKPDFSATESIDKVIMNRFLALPIFIFVLWAVFQLTFLLGEIPMGWFESFFAFLGETVSNALPDGLIRSLLVDGIIGGVGGVFSFVPNIVILFLLLSILEDVGYMSRAAFATDKFLHAFGLHGQSVFPMMLGFGCSVPAIMAARTLKSPRDRIITILVTPFMSCGAKLPVHVLLASALFPENAANMVMLIYAVGVVLSLLSAFILKKTVLRGDPTPFVMELPPYRAPTIKGVFWHVWEKTWQYIKKAGTIILASSILIWFITFFPSYEPSGEQIETLKNSYVAEHPGEDDEAVDAWVETALSEASLEHSYAGRFGKFIEPVFKPLGFDWKIAVASVTGFAAKEVVVSTMGILYKVGTEETEESTSLREAIRHDPNMSPLIGFVLMVFTLIIPPCFAALAAIKAEIGWKWLGFEIVFLLSLGWLLCFLIYQIGSLGGLG